MNFSFLISKNLLLSTIQYYSILFINTIFYLSLYYFNNPWIVLLIFYGILPLMDYYISLDIRNPTKEEMKVLRKNIWFKVPIYLSIIHDWLCLIWAIYYIQTRELNLLVKMGILLAVCNFEASSINVSHEIMHKSNTIEKIIGTLNLSKSLYMHFFIEHNYGHHKNVSTEMDPATSRYNESFYSFLYRSIYGSYVNSWHIENERCLEKYKRKLCIYNRMIYFTISYIVGPLSLWYFFSFTSMILFLTIAFASVSYLEVINYIEHYGLKRKEISPGIYENVTIKHSWNSPHRFSNYILFKLQRHSDHHENSMKPYQTLCSYDESPTLPQGYTTCLVMCLIPSTWFDIINPLLASYQNDGKGPSKELTEITNAKVLAFIHKIVFWSLALCFAQMIINLM